jgi:uncharacterized protein (TIGR04255 family)
MHKQYNNPPLFEVSCQIFFAPDKEWDVFFFSEFYEKISEDFPHKVTIQDFVLPDNRFIVHGENVSVSSPVIEKRSKMECKNEEGNTILTFKENFLGITVVPPYTGWKSFKELIAKVLAIYKEVVNPVLINRTVLKYRNKINVGTRHSYQSLSNVFTTKPHLEPLSANKNSLRATQMVLEFDSNDKKSILSIQQHTLRAEDEFPAPVLFDLGYLCIDALHLINDDVFEKWLEEANQTIHESFEASLTEQVKQTFN